MSGADRRRLLAAAVLAPWAGAAGAQAPAAPAVGWGRVERWARFESRHVDARPVDVWLPPDYDERVREGRRYAVVYMHDGQQLFDPAGTFNRQAWHVDRTARALAEAGGAEPFIVVGPWNNGRLRHSEFFPAGWLPHLPAPLRERFVQQALAGRVRSDEYLRFLVEELKPAVDARYATRPGREACWLMGSSMGGVISSYALWEHPRVFGGAACLSTHWIGSFERNTEFPQAAAAYLRQKPPAPATVRLWTDRGTKELDAYYTEAHALLSAQLAQLGFAPPRFRAEVFEGTGHNEADWGRRAEAPLRFLLGPLS